MDGWTYTWEQGRQLAGMSKSGQNITYKYNDSGIRTQKTVGNVTTQYTLSGDKVTFEATGTDNIHYTYDANGDLVSMNLNGTEYYYIRNAQGDITGLFDSTGAPVVQYNYDVWGKPVITLAELNDPNDSSDDGITGLLASTVGLKNPYRYRGYRYDTETGLYYLQSRYYNPEWSRFINADALLAGSGDLLEHNIFAYCANNPVNNSDGSGYIWETIVDIISMFWSAWDFIKKPNLGNFGYLAWDVGAAVLPFVPGSYTAKGAKYGSKAFSKIDNVGRTGKSLSKADDAIKGSKRIFNVTKQNSKIFSKFNTVKGKSYRYSSSGRNRKYYDWDFTHNDIEVYDRNGKHLGSMNPITGEMYKEAVKGRRLW